MKSLTLILTLIFMTTFSCSLIESNKSRQLASEQTNRCELTPILERFFSIQRKELKKKEQSIYAESAEECFTKAFDYIDRDIVRAAFKLKFGFEEITQNLPAIYTVKWKFNDESGTISKNSSRKFPTKYNYVVEKPTCYLTPAYRKSLNKSKEFKDESRTKSSYTSNWTECYQRAVALMKKTSHKTKKNFLSRTYPNPSYRSFEAEASISWDYKARGLLNDRSGYVDVNSKSSEPKTGDLRIK